MPDGPNNPQPSSIRVPTAVCRYRKTTGCTRIYSEASQISMCGFVGRTLTNTNVPTGKHDCVVMFQPIPPFAVSHRRVNIRHLMDDYEYNVNLVYTNRQVFQSFSGERRCRRKSFRHFIIVGGSFGLSCHGKRKNLQTN